MVQPTQQLACNGQPGIIKPGFERATYVGAAAVEALIDLVGSPAAAVIMAPVIAASAYDLLHICNSGDPGDPGLTVVDLVEAGQVGNFIQSPIAWDRIQQWFVHQMWPVWCNCSDGSTPPPSTSAPLPPATIDPGLPTGLTSAPCWTREWTGPAYNPTTPTLAYNLSEILLPAQQFQNTISLNPPNATRQPLIPAGMTQMRVDYTLTGSNQAADQPEIAIYALNAQGQNAGGPIYMGWNAAPSPQVMTVAQGATCWNISVSGAANSTTVADIKVTLFCTPNGNTVTQPCCPPDPILQQSLSSLIQMVQQLGNQLVVGNATLIPSTAHIGLTGTGSVFLQNACAAVQVAITNLPAGWPENPGTPDYLYSAGFITSYAIGSPLKGWRLVYQTQTFPLVAYADQIGYTLPPGLTITITEMLASP